MGEAPYRTVRDGHYRVVVEVDVCGGSETKIPGYGLSDREIESPVVLVMPFPHLLSIFSGS